MIKKLEIASGEDIDFYNAETEELHTVRFNEPKTIFVGQIYTDDFDWVILDLIHFKDRNSVIIWVKKSVF